MTRECIEKLKAEMVALHNAKVDLERRTAETERALEQMIIALYPRRDGDVFTTSDGDKVKIDRVIVGTDYEVFMTVHHRLPSGRWSKRTSYYHD
jgi:hypothetical protein